jgi:hypothetical protein
VSADDDQTLALFDDASDEDALEQDELDRDELERDEPGDGEPAVVEFEPRAGSERVRSLRTLWVVVAFAALVVIALTVGIVVFNASTPDPARGSKSAALAAQRYVAALNAGNGQRAAAAACDDFADQARADARSGADPGIAYTLDRVSSITKNDATALVTQHLKVGGGPTQNEPSTLSVLRTGRLWLICGRSSA